MLDNDLIRLNQKVNTVLHLRGKMIESDRVMEGVKVEREAAEKFSEAVTHADKKEQSKTIKRRDDLDPDDVKTAAAGEG
jgi:hypothetical protein